MENSNGISKLFHDDSGDGNAFLFQYPCLMIDTIMKQSVCLSLPLPIRAKELKVPMEPRDKTDKFILLNN